MQFHIYAGNRGQIDDTVPTYTLPDTGSRVDRTEILRELQERNRLRSKQSCNLIEQSR